LDLKRPSRKRQERPRQAALWAGSSSDSNLLEEMAFPGPEASVKKALTLAEKLRVSVDPQLHQALVYSY